MLDHINGVRDDNRPSNLRECTGAENQWNRHCVSQANRHGTKGITPLPNGKWQAQIKKHGKAEYLGCFSDKQQAVDAYNTAALAKFGQFAKLSEVAA